MAISLYDISVANYLQTLSATIQVLKKGEAFCKESDIDTSEFVKCRIYSDMLPLLFQVVSVAHHSLGVLKGIEQGVFGPPSMDEDTSYSDMIKLLQETKAELKAYSKESVDAMAGKPVLFKMGGFEIPFVAENFILSFSLPNFYFHATTAYDILRMKGVPLSKVDFLGPMRIEKTE